MAELATIYYTEADNSNQLIKPANTVWNHTNHLL